MIDANKICLGLNIKKKLLNLFIQDILCVPPMCRSYSLAHKPPQLSSSRVNIKIPTRSVLQLTLYFNINPCLISLFTVFDTNSTTTWWYVTRKEPIFESAPKKRHNIAPIEACRLMDLIKPPPHRQNSTKKERRLYNIPNSNSPQS